MAEEGLDIDGLNTLVLATPKKNIIQSIGRIMRKPIQEGDVNPLIVDVLDNMSCFKRWADDRMAYYNKNKYSSVVYRAFNNKVVPFIDYMVREGFVAKGDVGTDVDLRKIFITKRYGAETYAFQSRVKFMSFPESMFTYDCNYSEIFEINHDYTKNTVGGQTTVIDYNPTLYVET